MIRRDISNAVRSFVRIKDRGASFCLLVRGTG
jgi:hypothetical protein